MRRSWFGLMLLGLGAFLLVIGILCVTWAPGTIKKTPLDVNQTTELSGTVRKAQATGELGPVTPVRVQSTTTTDAEVSDDDVVVWVQSQCAWMDVDDAPDCPPDLPDGEADPRIVTVDYDIFASDRYTAEAVNDPRYFEDAQLPEDWVPHQGLVNKWPFDTKKKSYRYWDGTLGTTVPAVYDREASLLGIDCYVFTATIDHAAVDVAEGTPGYYDNQIEIWVEPRTGAIQQETQDQQRYLEDGTEVLDLQIGFTDAQQQAFEDDARGNLLLLDLVTVYGPVIGLAGGALCLVAGGLLLLTVRAGHRRSRYPA
jgi:hypothetical protein